MGDEPCGTAAACVRTIDQDRRCRLGNDRMAMMAQPPRNSCAGPSLLELLWEKLLEAYDKLMEITEDYDRMNSNPSMLDTASGRYQNTLTSLWAQKGNCLGLATAISIIVNPYDPNVDTVREELIERYELMGADSAVG